MKTLHIKKYSPSPIVREAELKLLAESRVTADPRYVDDVVEWIWNKVLDRKLKENPVSQRDQERKNALVGLYA